MTRTTTLMLSALAGAAFLAGCSSTPVAPQTPPVETRQVAAPAPAPAPVAAPAPTSQSRVTTVDLAAQQRAAEQAAATAAATAAVAAAAKVPRVIYFDFDSFAIKEEFKPTLDAHAKVLSTNKGRKLTVEGHADERGGREYNLALGQKRAEAVVKSMALLGATDAQVEAVSFGEERPAAQGQDEAAWAKNRRAELKDR
ncbi:MAG: peptidoglycan-associated lipoprotein Pal [Rubrivivax sp.]|jgi:peptidoglycan-associated lipoprotein